MITVVFITKVVVLMDHHCTHTIPIMVQDWVTIITKGRRWRKPIFDH